MGKRIKPNQKWGDIREVEKLYKNTKDADFSRKLQAIRLLMKDYSIVQVADILGCGKSTIKNWRDNWNKGGVEELKSNNKGRKSAYLDKVKKEVERIFDNQTDNKDIIVSGKMIHDFIKKNAGYK